MGVRRFGIVIMVAALGLASAGCGSSSSSSPSARPTPTTTVATTPAALSPSTTIDSTCAAESIKLEPTPIPVTKDATSVAVNLCFNQASSRGKRTFALQCRSDPTAPEFDAGLQCSNLSEVTWNSVESNTANVSFPVFHGREPSGDSSWGCFAPGEKPPAGVTAVPTCFIRFTNDSESNTADVLSVPIEFALS